MAEFKKSRFDSDNTEWSTPFDFFNPWNHIFKFTLDVCATAKNAKVQKYFDIQQNGLKQSWQGHVCWMNPPYGRDMVKWLQKAKYEADNNGVTTVCLIPSRTNTTWWHSLCLKASEIWFVIGRPKFGDMEYGLPLPLVVVVFAPNAKQCKIGSYHLPRVIKNNGKTPIVGDTPQLK